MAAVPEIVEKVFNNLVALPAHFRHEYVTNAVLPAVIKNYWHAGNTVMKYCISTA